MMTLPIRELTPAEISDYSGVSKRRINQLCALGKIPFEEELGRGGTVRKIKADDLPSELREKVVLGYAAKSLAELHGKTATIEDALTEKSEEELYEQSVLNSLADWARDRVVSLLTIIRALEGKKGTEIEKHLTLLRKENPDFKLGKSAFYRHRANYEKHGIQALIPNHGNNKGRYFAFEAIECLGAGVADKVFKQFAGDYLNQSRKTWAECHRIAKGYFMELIEDGECAECDVDEVFPSKYAFRYRLEREFTRQAITMARHGEKVYKDEHETKIEGDYSSLPAGADWESDNRILDVAVLPPQIGSIVDAEGNPIRPWLSLWYDRRTMKPMGWKLSDETPNANTHLEILESAIYRHGAPLTLRTDNGKDYRAKDTAGGRKEQTIKPIITRLGIHTTFVKPYNARAKTVERFFNDMAKWLDKDAYLYLGRNTVERPVEQEKKERKAGLILTLKQMQELVDQFMAYYCDIPRHYSKRIEKGLTINQQWEKLSPVLRQIPVDQLEWLRWRIVTKYKKVQANGVYFDGSYHYDDCLETMKGKMVLVLYNPQHPGVVRVIAEDGTYIGEAFKDNRTANIYAQTKEEQEEVGRQIGRQNAALKRTRKELEGLKKSTPQQAMSRKRKALQSEPTGIRIPIGELDPDARMFLSVDVVKPGTGQLATPAGQEVTRERILFWEALGVESVYIEKRNDSLLAMTGYARTAAERKAHEAEQERSLNRPLGDFKLEVQPERYPFWGDEERGSRG